MGAGQSSGLFSTQKGFTDESTRVSEIPKKILTLMFKHADFTDLLTLSNIEACPQYVFTSAQSLGNLFERIQIRPERGPAGEYIFAPIRRLAPELLKNSGATQPSLEDRLARDSMCVDVAYYHVRIFQIYAALALTVLNTNPLSGNMGSYAKATAPLGTQPSRLNFRAPAFSSRPPQAAYGGRRTRRKQVGGKITPSGAYSSLYNKILKTPFGPFLIPYFTPKRSGGFANSGTTTYLVMDDKAAGEFTVLWDQERTNDDMTLKSFYKIRGQNNARGSEAPIAEYSITMKKRISDRGTSSTMYIGREKIATFVEQLGNWRYFLNENDTEMFTEPSALYQVIHEYFGSKSDYNPGSDRQSGAQGYYSSSSFSSSGARIGRPMGKSSFDGFDVLYKMYGALATGSAAAPKAYLVARAMTLMTPIIESNPNEQVTCGVCKTSRLEFETNAEYLMPRPGTNPRANIYLRSFVSLFYDKYHVQREKNKKGVVLEKSQPGASELARASILLARLYNIPDRQEEFLESSVNFRGFESICGPARSRETNIYYTDPQLKEAMRAHIGKMLQFQNDHNERANRLLMRMFVLDLNTREGEKLILSRELEERGLNSVNDFCKEARELLLDYYLKSEAFYISGIMILESNKERLSSDALATRAPSERGYDPAYERQPY